MKKRLDLRCVDIGIFESREKARRAIMAGEVEVNGRVVMDCSFLTKDKDFISVKKGLCPYVSRGGLKLKAAIDAFNIDLRNKVCLDVGVATGGFSHCMLELGARKVYGVDVGKGQVHEKVLNDKRFVFIPNTNARYLTANLFDEAIEFAAVDVSFISLRLVIPPVLNSIKRYAEVVLLVKPQFELSKWDLVKGIVKTEELRVRALMNMKDFIREGGFAEIVGEMESPIKGISGNREFLLYIRNLKGYL